MRIFESILRRGLRGFGLPVFAIVLCAGLAFFPVGAHASLSKFVQSNPARLLGSGERLTTIGADSLATSFEIGEPPREARGVTYVHESLLDKKILNKNYVNKNQLLGKCTVGKGGGKCTVTVVSSSTRTVDVSLSISRETVAGKLGISSSKTVSNSVSCQSNNLKDGESWKAYPMGTRYSYRLEKLTMVLGQANIKDTSGTLYAFDPRPSDIYCTK